MLSIIPSLLTICNFICGMIAILASVEHKIGLGITCIFLGGLFDLFDGKVARKLNVVSTFGKELDSLADIVTFGVAPAMIVYTMSLHHLGVIGVAVIVIFGVCGLLRLARFNTTQSELSVFIGMPVPLAAVGLLVLSVLVNPALLAIFACLFAYFMISQIELPNFKKSHALVEVEHGTRS